MADPSSSGTTEALRYSHSGEQYVLGYGADFFGIWDRAQPGGPIARFPRTDAGWEQAWRDFTGRERRFVPVAGASPPGQAPSSERATRSESKLARVTIGLIGVSALLAVLTMAARAGLIARLHEFRRGAGSAAGVIKAGHTVDGLAVATSLMVVVAGVVWAIWQYRAQANLHALGASGLRYSPAAAAGWWWVPFANLVMPFLTVREIFTASRADADIQQRHSSGLLVAWWITWLAHLPPPLGAIAVAAIGNGSTATPDRLTVRASLGLATDAALVLAAVLAVAVVRAIQAGQEALLPRTAAQSVAPDTA